MYVLLKNFCFGGAGKSAVLTMQIKSSRAEDLMSEVYTVTALARRWEVHPQTVYRLLKKGVVRSFRVGGKIRIPIGAIEQHEQGGEYSCKQNRSIESEPGKTMTPGCSTSSDRTNSAHQHLRKIMAAQRRKQNIGLHFSTDNQHHSSTQTQSSTQADC